ncbi:hypothetical protein KY320_01590 [Candidatus Woesearchaeota archaeon]|nr:hypothetical protein [Candidatus Woesearchaeota archaeon]
MAQEIEQPKSVFELFSVYGKTENPRADRVQEGIKTLAKDAGVEISIDNNQLVNSIQRWRKFSEDFLVLKANELKESEE